MPLITDLPDGLLTALSPFRELFGAPAYRHFLTYVCGLIISENLTVEGINRNFVHRKHPSSLNRFLTWAIWRQEAVNGRRLEILKTEGEIGGKGWLVIDDTLTHKTGKTIEAVGIFKDHAEPVSPCPQHRHHDLRRERWYVPSSRLPALFQTGILQGTQHGVQNQDRAGQGIGKGGA